MIKLIINSKLFTKYRETYIKHILEQIESYSKDFCCHVEYSKIICWKDLKEVKENMKSSYLDSFIRDNKINQTCKSIWFITRDNRINFLKECLAKFNTKNELKNIKNQ